MATVTHPNDSKSNIPRPTTVVVPSATFEPYAPRSEDQRNRLSRIAFLTAGPTNASVSYNSTTKKGNVLGSGGIGSGGSSGGSSSSSNNGITYSLLLASMSHNNNRSDDENYDLYEYNEFEMENGILTNTSSVSSNDGPFHNSSSTLSFAKSTSSHLSNCIQRSIPVRTQLQKSIQVCQHLIDRHTDLLTHSGELSAAADRLQAEETILSKKAQEVGAPLTHYDALDKIGIMVGVLFKDEGNIVVRGLAKVKVDSDDYTVLLDQISMALEFFMYQYQQIQLHFQNGEMNPDYQEIPEDYDDFDDDPNLTTREKRRLQLERKKRIRELELLQSQPPNSGSVIEYYKRAIALHEAALFLIREAVVDRITQTTNDIMEALDLNHKPLSADKLEASLVYTRFHGISSRSNSLIRILRERLDTDLNQSYLHLLTLCQTTYAKCREMLLKHTVKEHMDHLKDQHGLTNMTRLASVFLIRLCTVETMLYLDFFAGDYKTEDEETTNNNDDSNTATTNPSQSLQSIYAKPTYKRKKTKTEKAAILATQDTHFQKHLSNLCTHLHKTVRRGLIAVNDLDTLCQIVSVLREEWSLANSSKNTLATARALSGVIQDAQERLIFCANTALNKEVVRFKPSPKDLDYPNKLIDKGKDGDSTDSTNNATTESDKTNHSIDNTKRGGDDAVQAQLRVYEAWFPPMRSVLRVLSKIFRVVEPRVFEDIAQQSVHSCTKSLKEGALHILEKSGIIHADLFLVKHLLILREQLSPFDIQLRTVERQLDFSDTGKAVTKFLANRNRKLFSMTNENALVMLLREGLSVQESSVDSKRDLEDSLRSACNDFIEHTSTTLAKPLFLFVNECKSLMNTSGLKGEICMHPESVIDTLSNTLENINEESSSIALQMSLYLENTATQSILMKPVARKIMRALEDSKRYVSEVTGETLDESNGNEDDWNDDSRAQVTKLIAEIVNEVKTIGTLKPLVSR